MANLSPMRSYKTVSAARGAGTPSCMARWRGLLHATVESYQVYGTCRESQNM